MTRRILLALLALTIAVLAGAVIPLALQAVAHEREAFVNAAATTAHSIAAISEDKLTGQNADPALRRAVKVAARQDDELLVLDRKGHIVVALGHPHDSWRPLAAAAANGGSQVTKLKNDRVVVIEPVWTGGRVKGSPVGMVVLERPEELLDEAVTNLWLYLSALAGGAMIAAALIAITFARWVNRPLARMDNAARQLADGDLAVRAAADSGPPELRRMAASFNMMAGRLETLVHGHRAMLADVSHQLRTPLAALRLRLDLLAADSAPPAAGELADAQDEIARLSRLVDGLLAVARAESVTEQIVSINLAPALAERIAAWQPVADAHEVKIAAGFGDGRDGPWVSLGSGHLEQILDNLLANAIDALPPGGTITVSAAKTASGATLTVADDGPGMPPEDRSRAFLRFVSGSKNGTGLGLAVVHRLVTSNGGTARLEETSGGGLTIVLTFPGSALYQ